MAHARLLLERSYVCQTSAGTKNSFPRRAMAASCWPTVSKNLPLLGHGRSHHPMYARQGEIKMSSRRWCHGSPDNQELAKKSCVPCNSKDIHAMPEDSAKKMLEQVGGWELATEGDILKLHKAWKVKNFVKGLEFLQLVAAVAEEEGHHPDLHLVGWNNVKIDIWTHSVRGLTDNDFVLAAKINNLNLEGLLSKKAAVQK
uniref:4a-hydroxytetrahydrobiopterin dehydratase n=1 Tax=Oryza punctata TaxID=4537 RepID=A0A0E0JM23_ORYPU